MADYFEFVSQGITTEVHHQEVFSVIRVYYDLTVQPWDLLHIVDMDTSKVYKFSELPAMDGLFVIHKLSSLAAARIRS